jgi:hypothetical protein
VDSLRATTTITNHDKSKTRHGHCQQPIQKLTTTAPRFQSSSFRCITSKPRTSGVLYHSAPHSINRRLLISKHSLSLQSVDYKTPGANLFTAASKRIDPVDPAPYAQHRRQVNNKTSHRHSLRLQQLTPLQSIPRSRHNNHSLLRKSSNALALNFLLPTQSRNTLRSASKCNTRDLHSHMTLLQQKGPQTQTK